MPAEGFVFSSFSQKFPDLLPWVAVRSTQRWKVWRPLISGSCTSPAAHADNHYSGRAINVWQKGVSSIHGDCSSRHLISSNSALKCNTHRHTHPARCSESNKANISVLNKTNTMQRALKDTHINLAMVPKEDLGYLLVHPYATENLCKYLGRCLSGHQAPLKKPVATFFTFNHENVKSDDMGRRIAWQQHQDCSWLEENCFTFSCLSVNVRSNSTRCSFQSLKMNEHIPQVKYKGSYLSLFQYNSIIRL